MQRFLWQGARVSARARGHRLTKVIVADWDSLLCEGYGPRGLAAQAQAANHATRLLLDNDSIERGGGDQSAMRHGDPTERVT